MLVGCLLCRCRRHKCITDGNTKNKSQMYVSCLTIFSCAATFSCAAPVAVCCSLRPDTAQLYSLRSTPRTHLEASVAPWLGMKSGHVAILALIRCMLFLLHNNNVVTAFLASSTTTTTTSTGLIAPPSSNRDDYGCLTPANRRRPRWCALSASTVGGDSRGGGSEPKLKPPLKVMAPYRSTDYRYS